MVSDQESSIFAVETDHDSLEALKDACRKAAMEGAFEFDTVRADRYRYTIKCKDGDCKWFIHAIRVSDSSKFRIQRSVLTHTCLGMQHNGHAQAMAKVIATMIEGKVRQKPDYSPTEIVDDVARELGIQISYSKAYRAKELALHKINGGHEDAYKLLPAYCENIKRTNPDSTVILDITSENRFRRLFLCFSASAMGFAHCRPIVGLDGTHLKHKYQGILLTATGIDATGSLFPLAYAVVDAENDENWQWFLRALRDVIKTHASQHLQPDPILVFLSDRQKGLVEGVENIFPDCPHGYCLRHLVENFHRKFKNVELDALIWKAACARTQDDYDNAINDMRRINPEAVEWLLSNARPEYWAELYFNGRRYGHLTSNIAESLNARLLKAREMPILAMLEEIRHQLMGWFAERRELERDTSGLIVSNVAQEIKALLHTQARRYHVIKATATFFEIRSIQTLHEYLVNLDDNTCSVRNFQLVSIN
jgi:hypothetical protein